MADGYVVLFPQTGFSVADGKGHAIGREAFAGAFLWLRVRGNLNPFSCLSIADGVFADVGWSVAANGLAGRVNSSDLLPSLRFVIADHKSFVFRLQAADSEIVRVDDMEVLPLACHVIAHRVLVAIWDGSTDIRIARIVEAGVIFPDTSLNVADGVFLGLWLLSAGPKVGLVKPCKLNPAAIEANRVVELFWDGFGAA